MPLRKHPLQSYLLLQNSLDLFVVLHPKSIGPNLIVLSYFLCASETYNVYQQPDLTVLSSFLYASATYKVYKQDSKEEERTSVGKVNMSLFNTYCINKRNMNKQEKNYQPRTIFHLDSGGNVTQVLVSDWVEFSVC